METNITAISKFAPEDISMDYERLRTEGIQHLEDLATYIWTDFNVHDPGITILEVLCYAITDLGYRANLPIEDLLAKGDGSFQKSFFPATDILPVCPVTRNDFRKVLIDFPGVRNAWVEKACPDDVLIYIKKEERDHEIDNRIEFICWLVAELKDLELEVLSAIIEKLDVTPDENKDLTKEHINCLRLIVDDPRVDPAKRTGLDCLIDIAELFVEHSNYSKTYYVSKFRNSTSEEVETIINSVLQEYYRVTDSDAYQEKISEYKLKLLADELKQEDGTYLFDLEFLLDCIDRTFPQISGITEPKGDVLRHIRITIQLVDKILCKFRCFETCFKAKPGGGKFTKAEIEEIDTEKGDSFERVCINGLYHICLDTHAPLEPKSKAARKLIERVRKGYIDEESCKEYKGLYNYRNLCEDFYDVQIVPTQNICLCLDITIDPEADENNVMAEVMFQLQEYLTPSVPFHSLQQLLEVGRTCDEIFNGPLLCNGFIDDQELEAAVIPEQIRLSDLYHIIMEVKYVQTVNGLKIKNEGDSNFVEDWCFDYRRGAESSCPIKPVIDLCCSSMFVRKGGVTHTVQVNDIHDLVDLFRLASRNLAGGAANVPDLPQGTYREDLENYISVQYEFPHNYAIGDNDVPADAPPLRKAQSKQLQAYLLFFDRLLADYLKQLSQVGNLLSVCQDPTTATYFYQTLYEVPGVKDLIKDSIFEITGDGLTELESQNLPSDILLQLTPLEGTIYYGRLEFEKAMNDLIGSNWNMYRTQLENTFINGFQTDEEWGQYQELEDSFYIRQLQAIVEKDDTRFRRKHRVLNHLLARFGEKFTEYTTQVFESRENHLQAKAEFLKALPELGLTRAKAYNYKAKDKLEGDVDVWNTSNVAGLKKRIYRLLGWGEATTESVFSNPVYRLDEEEDRKRDLPYRYLKLNTLDQNGKAKGQPLLVSNKSYSPRKILQLKPKLYILINNDENYSIVQQRQEDQYRVEFEVVVELKDKKKEAVKMSSVAMSKTEAEHLLRQVKKLLNVELRGGFHLVENLLLRPNDKGDQVLQMAFTCDLHFCPVDPYSFWLTVIAPAWKGPFQDAEFREYFMQLMHRETPAHLAICFKWVTEEDLMEKLEDALEQWREAYANCTPDECEITTKANILISLLNALPCDCYCFSPRAEPSKCETLCDKILVQ